jgi:hypothetical protein
MPRGGYRPGAGRKADPAKKAAREAAKTAKAREPHGYTTETGEKAPDAPKDWPFGREPAESVDPKRSFATPMEYWLHVLADPESTPSAKHAAAYAMAPYVHAKVAPSAKKEEAAAKSKKAAGGKYAASRSPVLAAANGKRV